MFGKGKSKMSANDKAVMAAGRAAGNLKSIKSKPFSTPRGGANKHGKAGPNPFGDKPLSLGQVNTFETLKTRGK